MKNDLLGKLFPTYNIDKDSEETDSGLEGLLDYACKNLEKKLDRDLLAYSKEKAKGPS